MLDERDRMLERSETRYRQLVELVPAVVILFKMVVENHGGTLTFETESGAGTTFHVRLPIGSTADVLEAA